MKQTAMKKLDSVLLPKLSTEELAKTWTLIAEMVSESHQSTFTQKEVRELMYWTTGMVVDKMYAKESVDHIVDELQKKIDSLEKPKQ